MRNRRKSWEADFPIREEVEDHAGKTRTFVINCHEGGLGWTVRAQEEGRRGAGYEFAAYSETSPYRALGRLRQKMYRGVATRHISGSPGALARPIDHGLGDVRGPILCGLFRTIRAGRRLQRAGLRGAPRGGAPGHVRGGRA